MSSENILKLFKEHQALLEGHFLLSSGLHSPQYLQTAMLLQYPDITEKLSRNIAGKIRELNLDIQCVVSPAVGGIVIGHEIARTLNVRSIYTERVDGKMTLRRGFNIHPNEKILIADGIITTGGSPIEVMQVVQSYKGQPVAIAVLVDRSNGSFKPTIPVISLLQIKFDTYTSENCPLCQQKIPLLKPGSRI